MILRNYQLEAKRAVFQKLCDNKATLLEMATGCGKTIIFADIANEWPGRVLVIAHRDELIRQAAEKIQAITGHPVGIEMGRDRADDTNCRIIVASVQTLARANRRHRYAPDHFSLIVVDEGHHGAAVTYQETLNYFTNARILLVTATAKRADKVIMESVYQSVAYQYGIERAIDDGWLVPIKQTMVKIDGLDFSKCRTVAKDFNIGDLERILTQEKPLHEMCLSAVELIGARQALWFCVTVVHARMMANVLSRYAGGSNVAFLSGDTPIEERRYIVDSYRKGNIQHLLNCQLFLEGADFPACSAIVMARQTKSLGLYMQVLGRGTRTLPGVIDGLLTVGERKLAIATVGNPPKCDMLVIDFKGNAGRHKIIQATDALEGKYALPVREYARNDFDTEGRAIDIDEILQTAKDELALLRQEEERMKQVKANAVQFRTQDVDPFTRRYASRQDRQKRAFEPCSDKTAWKIFYLSKKSNQGWTFAMAKGLTQRQARGVIGKLRKMAGVRAG